VTEKPGVASHLKIPLDEYDARIRTFVPYYEEMLDEIQATVASLDVDVRDILDLGIGTGALAERCLEVTPGARLVGIDTDPGMLDMARTRLEPYSHAELRCGSFLDEAFPESDLIVASISLHHVPEAETKKALYRRCEGALRAGGLFLQADCFPSSNPRLAVEGMRAWEAHLERHYTPEETRRYLDAWSEEDTHFPLSDEVTWLEEAGFRAEVVWRKGAWAVLFCT
jgi:tRNA (cmo5U34)-methyltransferase